jgi:hypothetical protein
MSDELRMSEEFEQKLEEIENVYKSICNEAKSKRDVEIQKLYEEYKKQHNFDESLQKFVEWWKSMIEITDFNYSSNSCCRITIVGLIEPRIFTALSKIKYPIKRNNNNNNAWSSRNITGFDSFYFTRNENILFCVPWELGFEPEKAHILKLSNELKFFTKLYKININIIYPKY